VIGFSKFASRRAYEDNACGVLHAVRCRAKSTEICFA
jgi:hypothetical protein